MTIVIKDKQFTPATLGEDGETVLAPSVWTITATIDNADGSRQTVERIEGDEDMTDDALIEEIEARWGL